MSNFADLHPDKAGGPIDQTSVNTGLNFDNGDYPESGFIRCRKCNQIMNRHRHAKGREVGNTQAATLLNGSLSKGGTTVTVDSNAGFPTPKTGSITAFASAWSGKKTTVTAAAHGLKGGNIVTITSTTSYDGTFYIGDIFTNTFTITVPFVADDATGTWTIPEYLYIYNTGSHATDEDVSTTYTAATNGPKMTKVKYTAKGGTTTFTGCTGVLAHDDDMYVKSERIATSGCPFCGTYLYD